MPPVSIVCVAAAYACFGVLGILLAVIDLRTHRLPNRWVSLAGGVGCILLPLAAFAADAPGRSWGAVLGAGAVGAGYLLLWLATPAGIGAGDVKLAAVVGLHLGWWGWPTVILGTAFAFVLGGLAALGAVIVARGDRGAAIPFGPWMIGGAWTAMVPAM
ncbi:hypothetical protein GCM10009808_10840 [Microbacterium sediminicola]|uniref:Prepilin type IV endopeptidase peptidase domain-containing protein n=1 Tax=Microbacterium sediminicola TaxID=415210 RepID=A0ABN2HY28_9MICO